MNNFNKANPTHNPDKLDWFNQQYLQQYSSDKFVELFKDWFNEYHNPEEFEVDLDEFTEEQLDLALKLEQERISVLNEMPEKLKNFIEFPEDLDWSHRLTEKLDDASKKEILQNYLKFIESEKYSQESGHDEWENGVRQIISDLELKAGQVFMTLRIAITGQSQTPPLFDFIRVIGEEEHHSRVKLVIERLG
jgi:glutamyl/glutaminyl-tRNA synthetase